MEYGVDGADSRVQIELNWVQRAVVRMRDEKSENVNNKRGVRQGCALSLDLFSLYIQIILEEVSDL